MRKNSFNKCCLIIAVCVIISMMFSCSTAKKIKYFEDIPDSGALKTIPVAAYIEPKIQIDDILTIIVTTVDPAATQVINLGNIAVGGGAIPGGVGSSVGSQPTVSGYLVNKEGNVELPVLGEIKLTGLTTEEARQAIKVRAAHFFNDPSVVVRYANFKVTVTGEVARPSIYVMPNEKVTILDALTLAGDLTIYGKRDNILLLRDDENGIKKAYRVNLTKSDLINEPYYYLHQNDLIYVEPTKAKAAANDIAQTRNIAIYTSVLTLIILIVSRINFK